MDWKDFFSGFAVGLGIVFIGVVLWLIVKSVAKSKKK
jgi:hypothetical protein